MIFTPGGHLIVANGKDGQLVEIDPARANRFTASGSIPTGPIAAQQR